jgi:oligosaccharide repeat unit polymerase
MRGTVRGMFGEVSGNSPVALAAKAPAATAIDTLAATLFFAMAGVLALGICLFALGFYSARTLVLVHAAEIALTVMISILLGKLRGDRLALFEPSMVVNAMFLVYYSVRPIYLMTAGSLTDSEIFAALNPAVAVDYAWAVGYAVLGLLSFHAGYWTMKSRLCETSRSGECGTHWSSTRVTRVMILGGLWALASLVAGVFAAGGVAGTLANVGRLREVTAGYAYALLGTAFFPIGAIVLLVDHLLGHSRAFWVACFCLMSVGYSALLGNRTGMFAIVVSCIIVYAYIHGIRSYWRSAVWLIAIGLVLVPTIVLWGVAREQSTSFTDVVRIANLVLDQDPRLLYAQTLNEFSAVDSFAAVLHGGPSIFPFQYGKTYLDVLLFLVPRTVWPDKPKAFSTAVGDYVTEDSNDVPPGVIGELYVNFHGFGVVAGMFFLGWLMGFIHHHAVNGSFGALAMYAFLIPYFGVFLSRNFLGGGILLLTTVTPMWPAIRYIEGSHTRTAGATGGSDENDPTRVLGVVRGD